MSSPSSKSTDGERIKLELVIGAAALQGVTYDEFEIYLKGHEDGKLVQRDADLASIKAQLPAILKDHDATVRAETALITTGSMVTSWTG